MSYTELSVSLNKAKKVLRLLKKSNKSHIKKYKKEIKSLIQRIKDFQEYWEYRIMMDEFKIDMLIDIRNVLIRFQMDIDEDDVCRSKRMETVNGIICHCCGIMKNRFIYEDDCISLNKKCEILKELFQELP